MVIHSRKKAGARGVLMMEMAVAMAILMIAFLPVAYSVVNDARYLRQTYQHAVAMEIVDGEMEILAAGAWHDQPEGAHPYAVAAGAARNLPPGDFTFTRNGNHLRLEWKSDQLKGVGIVVREVTVQ